MLVRRRRACHKGDLTPLWLGRWEPLHRRFRCNLVRKLQFSNVETLVLGMAGAEGRSGNPRIMRTRQDLVAC